MENCKEHLELIKSWSLELINRENLLRLMWKTKSAILYSNESKWIWSILQHFEQEHDMENSKQYSESIEICLTEGVSYENVTWKTQKWCFCNERGTFSSNW